MNITFHGAARTVTGSKHLLKLTEGIQILLDCGMFQGMGEDTEELNGSFGFNPQKVDYLILSHAHIDHCGLIPKLVAEGFSGSIFCTAGTMDLARILLLDSANIQTHDVAYSNKHRIKKGLPLLPPLYTEEDVLRAMRMFKIVGYNENYQITPRITLLFTDAGHVLGSAAIHLSIFEDAKQTQVTFSGDVGRYGDLLLKDPQSFPQADCIIIETTYGDSLHKDLDPIADTLRDIIHQTCMLRGGKVIIPAFSVGRTQEILYALNELEQRDILPDIAYYVDSPLSEKATQVLKNHPEVYNSGVKELMKTDKDPFSFKGLQFVQSVGASKALNGDSRPCVIISSSGMAEAGRVKHHIRNNLGNNRNTILMVGYCEPNSLGGRLIAGNKNVRIFAEEYQVLAEIKSIKSMSAHGDYEDLLRFLKVQDPIKVKKVFLVHGEYPVQLNFKEKLNRGGFLSVEIPIQHQTVKI
ncbi:MAG: MBL fold metallo-hydrolase RNA specificity domain-containing protein [Sphingobacteriaceae bacterium]